MSVEEIKISLKSLSSAEQEEISKYLVGLRLYSDELYREEIARRSADKDPAHWVSIDELKRQFPGDWSDA